MYTAPFFQRGDREEPERSERSERKKTMHFFQKGHRGRILFLLMESYPGIRRFVLEHIVDLDLVLAN